MDIQAVLCMMTQDRLREARANLERAAPHFDAAVVVDNGSTDGTREWLASFRESSPVPVHVVHRQWDDSFTGARNRYLDVVGRIAEESGQPTWACVADDDEVYSDGLLESIHEVVAQGFENDLNVLGVESRSVETDWKGDVHRAKFDGWHKPLLLLWEPGLRYGHSGQTEVHEDPTFPSGARWNIVVNDGKLWYEHRKRHGDIWVRGIRNAFAGGGGMNLGDAVPFWRDFRGLVEEHAGVATSDRFVRWLREADALPGPIHDFLLSKRLLGTGHDPTPPLWIPWPDGCSEWREGWLARYVVFRPDQMPLDIAERDRAIGYMDYAEHVRIIWGPDSPDWARA